MDNPSKYSVIAKVLIRGKWEGQSQGSRYDSRSQKEIQKCYADDFSDGGRGNQLRKSRQSLQAERGKQIKSPPKLPNLQKE